MTQNEVLAFYAGGRILQKLRPQSVLSLNGKHDIDLDYSCPKDEDCIERTVDITLMGRIYAELETVAKKEQQVPEMAKIRDKGMAVKQVLTRSTLQQFYEVEEDNKVTMKMSYKEPNMQTIVNDVFKTNGHHLKLITSHFVYAREVKISTKGLDQNNKKLETRFIEPVLVSLASKSEMRDEDTSTDGMVITGVTHTDASQESKCSAEAVRIPKEIHQIRLFYHTKVKKNQFVELDDEEQPTATDTHHTIIKSVVIPTFELKHAICQVRREQAKYSSFSELLVDASEKDESQKLPEIKDRGIIMKIIYDEHNKIVEVEEMTSKLGVTRTLVKEKVVKRQNAKCVRYNNQNNINPTGYKVDKNEYDTEGINTKFNLSRKSNNRFIYEEVRQPGLEVMMKYILMITKKNFNGTNYYFNKDLNTRFFLKPYYEIINGEDKKEGELDVIVKLDMRKNADRMQNFEDVNKLKNKVDIAKIEEIKGCYQLSGDNLIDFTDEDKSIKKLIEDWGSHNARTGRGKDILKFALYTTPGRFITDLELKTQIIKKTQRKNNNNNAGSESSMNNIFDWKELDYEVRITETPIVRSVEVAVKLKNDETEKCLLMTTKEPNILTIIAARTFDCEDFSKDDTATFLTKLKARFSKAKHTRSEYFTSTTTAHVKKTTGPLIDSHKAACPYYQFGLFAIQSHTNFYEIVPRNRRDDTPKPYITDDEKDKEENDELREKRNKLIERTRERRKHVPKGYHRVQASQRTDYKI
ncbi:hypothetical protein Ciccas_013415, partial [Cichlidogyrus casuarinus]